LYSHFIAFIIHIPVDATLDEHVIEVSSPQDPIPLENAR
jgi:hypothetical protein